MRLDTDLSWLLKQWKAPEALEERDEHRWRKAGRTLGCETPCLHGQGSPDQLFPNLLWAACGDGPTPWFSMKGLR